MVLLGDAIAGSGPAGWTGLTGQQSLRPPAAATVKPLGSVPHVPGLRRLGMRRTGTREGHAPGLGQLPDRSQRTRGHPCRVTRSDVPESDTGEVGPRRPPRGTATIRRSRRTGCDGRAGSSPPSTSGTRDDVRGPTGRGTGRRRAGGPAAGGDLFGGARRNRVRGRRDGAGAGRGDL